MFNTFNAWHVTWDKTFVSGPIMPRITECLAQRQEVAPEEVEEVSVNEKQKLQKLYKIGEKKD